MRKLGLRCPGCICVAVAATPLLLTRILGQCGVMLQSHDSTSLGFACSCYSYVSLFDPNGKRGSVHQFVQAPDCLWLITCCPIRCNVTLLAGFLGAAIDVGVTEVLSVLLDSFAGKS